MLRVSNGYCEVPLPRTRAEEVIELENLLQCECRLLALSGHAVTVY
jgi:hypothetical protein